MTSPAALAKVLRRPVPRMPSMQRIERYSQMGVNQLLKPGQTVRTEASGLPCEVVEFLGGGGQGEVYRATLSGQPVALKWYLPAAATVGQREAIELLVRKGPPTDRFLWPVEVASAPGVPGYGYVMPLREPRYHGIVDLMKRRIEP